MEDQTRNLNPTPAAVVAMWVWGERYSKQNGGSMDFWDGLSDREQKFCQGMADKVIDAHKRHAR